jgi:hypothetical protein
MIKLQSDVGKKGKKKYTSIIDVLRKDIPKDGIKGIYAGCFASALRYFIYRGL